MGVDGEERGRRVEIDGRLDEGTEVSACLHFHPLLAEGHCVQRQACREDGRVEVFIDGEEQLCSVEYTLRQT